MESNFFKRKVEQIERILPMTINSLILFLLVAYLLFVVGRSVWINYQSRHEIINQKEEIVKLKDEISLLEFQIAYFQTNTFKEKEARAKLGYRAPGEKVLSILPDTDQDKIADREIVGRSLKTPNYVLWWYYFFGD